MTLRDPKSIIRIARKAGDETVAEPLDLGLRVRDLRKAQGWTLEQAAKKAGLARSTLSKIENGVTSPSLTTLQTLAHALSVPLTALFTGFEETRGVMHVKAGTAVEIERQGTRAGHQYNLLGHIGANSSGVVVEPYLIVLNETSDVFPTFQHEGIELIYMLEGRMEYRHGDSLFTMEPGDSLFFDADAAHGPEVLGTLPIRYLSVISYPQGA